MAAAARANTIYENHICSHRRPAASASVLAICREEDIRPPGLQGGTGDLREALFEYRQDQRWPTPWMARVLPVVVELAGRHPERTVFTRFITPMRADAMPGMWRRYYSKWRDATHERIDPALLELAPPLARFSPPAPVIDKTRYSAFADGALLAHLQARQADGLVVTGSETDVCVLATVLGAVDLGYRVIVVRDAVCSSSDEATTR